VLLLVEIIVRIFHLSHRLPSPQLAQHLRIRLPINDVIIAMTPSPEFLKLLTIFAIVVVGVVVVQGLIRVPVVLITARFLLWVLILIVVFSCGTKSWSVAAVIKGKMRHIAEGRNKKGVGKGEGNGGRG